MFKSCAVVNILDHFWAASPTAALSVFDVKPEMGKI